MSEELLTVLANLKSINHQSVDYEIRKLHAIKDWALDRVGIDYREGDRVQLTQDIACSGGWASYAECLIKGATGIVKRIDFGVHHKEWFADFVPDREWKMWVERPGGKIHRVWNGKLEDLPDGMEPMCNYDLEKYPDGKHHTFMFNLEWMKKCE